jgi:hypothetical protein
MAMNVSVPQEGEIKVKVKFTLRTGHEGLKGE